MIYNIIHDAKGLGACNKVENADNIAELVELFFSPQGIEFCMKNKFPKLSTFREVKDEILKYPLFIDSDAIYRQNDAIIGLIGKTRADLKFDQNNYVNTVILMHGATAHIKASNYAVLNIVKMSNCTVELDIDNTVIVL